MSELTNLREQLASTGLYEPDEGSLVYAELAAYAEGLDLFFGRLDEMLAECFISTAESYGFAAREREFRSARFANGTEQKRAALIKAMSVNPGDFNASGMEKVRDSFGVSGSYSYDSQTNKLTFTCTTAMNSNKKTQLTNDMKKMMPCWVNFEIVLANA